MPVPADFPVAGDGQAPRAPPPVETYPLRNDDHRYEFTRLEFREWATGLAGAHGYAVAFDGIGGGPFEEVVPHGEWRGGGPCSQVAIFERQPAAPPAAPAPEGAEGFVTAWSSDE